MQNYDYEYKRFNESSLSNNEGRGPFFGVDDSWFYDFVDGDRLFGDFCYDNDTVTCSDSSDGMSFLAPVYSFQSTLPIPIPDQPRPNPSIPLSPPSATLSDYEDSMSIFSTNSSLTGLSKLPSPVYSSVPSGSDTTKIMSKRERNRQAAERCRKRRTDLISNLQADCEALQREKEALLVENARLRAMLK